MGALALLIEKWSFNMNAENARNVFCAGRFHGSYCFRQNLRRIGDDRRQHPRRSELAMGFGNAADRIDCGIVIEQGAATAVHLHVNESRHEKSAVQDAPLNARSEFFLRYNFDNAVTVNDNSEAIANALTIENAGSC